MLLTMIASLATSLGADPKKTAKFFMNGGDKKWLMDFTLETTKLKMQELSKKKK